jgi:hypothetical protein
LGGPKRRLRPAGWLVRLVAARSPRSYERQSGRWKDGIARTRGQRSAGWKAGSVAGQGELGMVSGPVAASRLGGMETRWPGAGPRKLGMVRGPVAGSKVGRLEGPTGAVSGRTLGRMETGWPVAGPTAKLMERNDRRRRQARRCGPTGGCRRQSARNHRMDHSGVRVQRDGGSFRRRVVIRVVTIRGPAGWWPGWVRRGAG